MAQSGNVPHLAVVLKTQCGPRPATPVATPPQNSPPTPTPEAVGPLTRAEGGGGGMCTGTGPAQVHPHPQLRPGGHTAWAGPPEDGALRNGPVQNFLCTKFPIFARPPRYEGGAVRGPGLWPTIAPAAGGASPPRARDANPRPRDGGPAPDGVRVPRLDARTDCDPVDAACLVGTVSSAPPPPDANGGPDWAVPQQRSACVVPRTVPRRSCWGNRGGHEGAGVR